MTWGLLPVPYRVPELLDFPLFKVYGTQATREEISEQRRTANT